MARPYPTHVACRRETPTSPSEPAPETTADCLVYFLVADCLPVRGPHATTPEEEEKGAKNDLLRLGPRDREDV